MITKTNLIDFMRLVTSQSKEFVFELGTVPWTGFVIKESGKGADWAVATVPFVFSSPQERAELVSLFQDFARQQNALATVVVTSFENQSIVVNGAAPKIKVAITTPITTTGSEISFGESVINLNDSNLFAMDIWNPSIN